MFSAEKSRQPSVSSAAHGPAQAQGAPSAGFRRLGLNGPRAEIRAFEIGAPGKGPLPCPEVTAVSPRPSAMWYSGAPRAQVACMGSPQTFSPPRGLQSRRWLGERKALRTEKGREKPPLFHQVLRHWACVRRFPKSQGGSPIPPMGVLSVPVI